MVSFVMRPGNNNNRPAASGVTAHLSDREIKLYRRRGRKAPPFQFDPDTPPPYQEGYLQSRYVEYNAFDQLPLWARKALRRTKREWQARQILARLKDGDLPVDIISDLEYSERVCSESHLHDHKL